MVPREHGAPALRPVAGRVCIVMACADTREADLVSRQLSDLKTGCLVTYRRAEDLLHNAPAGKVALIILATADTAVQLDRTLTWLRRRWPRCPITVVGDRGGESYELAARKGGAFYLTRPVTGQQWSEILRHALQTALLSKAVASDGSERE